MPDRNDDPLAALARHWTSGFDAVRIGGTIVSANATSYRATGLSAHVRVGDCVTWTMEQQSDLADLAQVAQVISIDATTVTLVPFNRSVSLSLGSIVWRQGPLSIAVDERWTGRIVNATADPIDGRGALPRGPSRRTLDTSPPDALQRQRVATPLKTGVKVIDLFTPLCAGQRIGIFAGSGVGKSTLLGMIARAPSFDRTILALVGERSREVREFVEDVLGANLATAVVVVATGDESPMMRVLAPRTAMTIAEYFRDRGEHVLVIVDSITRYAHALREVALASGEPPVARGYAPSVFTDLPKLLERAGPGATTSGTITGLFSVLVDGDDHNEPVADSVRGILDGHIVLDREIAARAQFPAVDILRSISRLAETAWSADQRQTAKRLKALVMEYESTRELRMLGVYKPGANVELDRAISITPRIYKYLNQSANEFSSIDVFQEIAAVLGAPA
jgi:flagellum-specific ATP synthase